ncbi:hypothetical protein ISR94_03015 [Candidatus Microgenomates bacterium]|nr:hypothetical protein [Candidatus Microgenomates bacterium]
MSENYRSKGILKVKVGAFMEEFALIIKNKITEADAKKVKSNQIRLDAGVDTVNLGQVDSDRASWRS